MLLHAIANPSDQILLEISNYRLIDSRLNSEQDLMRAASDLLREQLELPGYPPLRISVPFDPAHTAIGDDPRLQLLFEGFVVPDILLRAYELSHRVQFLALAAEDITSWAAYENKRHLLSFDLLNEHAIAERVIVLATFWRFYRHSELYRPDVARQVLQFVTLLEQVLADPSLFSGDSNHGVMQNLALLHATLAFPSLPFSNMYEELAFRRLSGQMKFYINSEGVVLEHSPGYQSFGIDLLSRAFRYADLLHHSIPKDWLTKHQSARDVYSCFLRPDGSLPTIGDTDGGIDSGPLVTDMDAQHHTTPLRQAQKSVPKASVTLLPIAGYSIWWDGLSKWPAIQYLAQTVVTWADFPSHVHKHADEMSLILWATGQQWWGNVGYWPYNTPGRHETESWAGSNAPHLTDEPSDSVRSTRLLGTAYSSRTAVLDLERRGPKGYVARRQVIHIRPSLWFVIDSTDGDRSSRTTTTWTTAPNVTWLQGGNGKFTLRSSTGPELRASLLASSGTTEKMIRGSFHPFGGWQVENQADVPSSAMIITQPAAHSWAIMTWSLRENSTGNLEGVQVAHWDTPDRWTIRVMLGTGQIALTRDMHTVSIQDDLQRGTSKELLELKQPPNVQPEVDALQDSFLAATSHYRLTKYDLLRRLKLTLLVLCLVPVQVLFLYVASQVPCLRSPRRELLAVVAWIVLAVWTFAHFSRPIPFSIWALIPAQHSLVADSMAKLVPQHSGIQGSQWSTHLRK